MARHPLVYMRLHPVLKVVYLKGCVSSIDLPKQFFFDVWLHAEDLGKISGPYAHHESMFSLGQVTVADYCNASAFPVGAGMIPGKMSNHSLALPQGRTVLRPDWKRRRATVTVNPLEGVL